MMVKCRGPASTCFTARRCSRLASITKLLRSLLAVSGSVPVNFRCRSARLDHESLVPLQHGHGALAERLIGGAGNLDRQLRSQLARLGQGTELRRQCIVGRGQVLELGVEVGKCDIGGKLPGRTGSRPAVPSRATARSE